MYSSKKVLLVSGLLIFVVMVVFYLLSTENFSVDVGVTAKKCSAENGVYDYDKSVCLVADKKKKDIAVEDRFLACPRDENGGYNCETANEICLNMGKKPSRALQANYKIECLP